MLPLFRKNAIHTNMILPNDKKIFRFALEKGWFSADFIGNFHQ